MFEWTSKMLSYFRNVHYQSKEQRNQTKSIIQEIIAEKRLEIGLIEG